MSTKSIGDFGEYLTAFLLEKKFEKENLLVIKIGGDNLPYDLLIPFPRKGTPFHRPTAISVKTRGTWSEKIPPDWNTIQKVSPVLKENGYDLWVSLVLYRFEANKLQFEIYLTPVEHLNYPEDFTKIGDKEQILSQRIKNKALLKFETC